MNARLCAILVGDFCNGARGHVVVVLSLKSRGSNGASGPNRRY
ncbi:Hypothetical protein A7982_06163 [Minicystis rosea]|nr:Hypothetical protein A7982_06163 [Minicystis rosea]